MTPRVTSPVDRSWISYPGLRSCRRLTGVTNASAPLGLLIAPRRYALTLLGERTFSQWMGQCPKGAHAWVTRKTFILLPSRAACRRNTAGASRRKTFILLPSSDLPFRHLVFSFVARHLFYYRQGG